MLRRAALAVPHAVRALHRPLARALRARPFAALGAAHGASAANDSRYAHVAETLARSPLYGKAPVPRLPVPSLEDTARRFCEYLRPLTDDREFAEVQALAKSWASDAGIQELQMQLEAYASHSNSYIERIWDLAYVQPRCGTMVNISPYLMLEDEGKMRELSAADRQAPDYWLQRAGRLVTQGVQFYRRAVRHELPAETERGAPLDMSQYEWLLGSARVPQLMCDTVARYADSRHIVVMCGNRAVAVDVIDSHGAQLAPGALAHVLGQIVESVRADRAVDASRVSVRGAATACSRNLAAVVRPLLGPNVATLDSAIMVVCLDDQADHEVPAAYRVPDAQRAGASDLDRASHRMLHAGGGYNRWFDKTVQLMVSPDGVAGINLEHSPVDGHTLLGLIMHMQTGAPVPAAELSRASATPPTFHEVHLDDANEHLRRVLPLAEREAQALARQVRSRVVDIESAGTEFAKRSGVSPDAFVQMALQVAQHRLYGLTSTYESAMTKGFFHGRTEAMRSVTSESRALCEALAGGASSAAVVGALRAACAAHVARAKECKNGMGIDRHLYAMSSIASGQGYSHPLFSSPYYRRISRNALSTSNVSSDALRVFGFGAVDAEGVGVGYILRKNSITLNVTSFETRDAHAFAGEIVRAVDTFAEHLAAAGSAPAS